MELTDRVERLERENRRLKAIGVLTLAMMTSLLIMGQVASPRVYEADRFLLTTTSGEGRGGLLLTGNGLPNLALVNRGQQTQILVSILDETVPMVSVRAPDGGSSASLTVSKNGMAGLALHGSRGEVRGFMGVAGGSSPVISSSMRQAT
jgi:hypothetical protein